MFCKVIDIRRFTPRNWEFEMESTLKGTYPELYYVEFKGYPEWEALSKYIEEHSEELSESVLRKFGKLYKVVKLPPTTVGSFEEGNVEEYYSKDREVLEVFPDSFYFETLGAGSKTTISYDGKLKVRILLFDVSKKLTGLGKGILILTKDEKGKVVDCQIVTKEEV